MIARVGANSWINGTCLVKVWHPAAQTAKGQTQNLRDQVVDLVAGVQAPDKLSGVASSSESWMKIANIKSTGSAYAFVQFIIGGGSDYGAR